ncbi:MAG: hypothetical protein ACLUW8_14050 [Subdoligranulum sp.]
MTLAQLFDLAFGNIGRFFKEIAFKKEERGKLSYGLVGTLILVLTYGLIMLFSASYSTGYYRFKGGYLPLYPPAGNSGGGGAGADVSDFQHQLPQPAPHELVLIHFNAAAFGVGPVQ